jgi:NADH-quinone oxidoreductase subunit B
VYGILKLRAMVMAKPDEGWRTRYGGRGTEEFVESELAIDPASAHADNVTGASGRMGPSA